MHTVFDLLRKGLPSYSQTLVTEPDIACTAGHVNHSIFWQNLTPPKVGN